MKPYKVIK